MKEVRLTDDVITVRLNENFRKVTVFLGRVNPMGEVGGGKRARNFMRISETNFSSVLRSRRAGVVNFWR